MSRRARATSWDSAALQIDRINQLTRDAALSQESASDKAGQAQDYMSEKGSQIKGKAQARRLSRRMAAIGSAGIS